MTKIISNYDVRKLARIDNPDTLMMSDKSGWSVAHEMASQGYVFTDKKILKLSDNKGWTVASEMARRGYKFTDPKILELVNAEVRITSTNISESSSKLGTFSY